MLDVFQNDVEHPRLTNFHVFFFVLPGWKLASMTDFGLLFKFCFPFQLDSVTVCSPHANNPGVFVTSQPEALTRKSTKCGHGKQKHKISMTSYVLKKT
jgi:hypothetical protein